jgi:repressor LexA
LTFFRKSFILRKKEERGERVSIGKNIRRLRERRGLTQKELAAVLGVTDKAISAWEKDVNEPLMGNVQAMADFFCVLKSDIIEDRHRIKGVKIPVLGRVQAGVPVEAVEEILDYEEITQELADTGDFFALQIRGDSMEPKFSAGDVVIIRKQPDANTGDTVVVLVNGDDATVKRLKKHEDGSLSLIPTNSSYDPMFFSREEVKRLPVTVLGKVVELRAKF